MRIAIVAAAALCCGCPPKTGSILVTWTPKTAAAEFFLDGSMLSGGAGQAIEQSEVPIGEHILLARAIGFKDRAYRFNIRGNEQIEVQVELELLPPSPSAMALDYVELPAKDLERTKAFYGQVFDWEFADRGPDHASFNTGRITGSFNTTREAAVGGALVVIYSADLTKTRDAIRAAGGTIEQDIFDFPGGKQFYFLDPNGNELAVWSER